MLYCLYYITLKVLIKKLDAYLQIKQIKKINFSPYLNDILLLCPNQIQKNAVNILMFGLPALKPNSKKARI